MSEWLKRWRDGEVFVDETNRVVVFEGTDEDGEDYSREMHHHELLELAAEITALSGPAPEGGDQ